MGGDCLRELRPYWVKILPHYHMITAVLSAFFIRKVNSKKNQQLPIDKFPLLVLLRNAMLLCRELELVIIE